MGMRRFPVSVRRLYNKMRRLYENVRRLYWYDAVIFLVFEKPVLGRPLLGPAMILLCTFSGNCKKKTFLT